MLMVLFCHVYMIMHDAGKTTQMSQNLQNTIRALSLSMDGFFVLSGFLISGPLFLELQRTGTLSLRVFFIKRFFRIFPPYYIFLTLQLILILSFVKLSKDNSNLEVGLTLLNRIKFDYLYLSNFFPGTLFQGWSLSLEEQFYISFPLFLLFVFKKANENQRLISLVILTLIPFFYRLYAFLYILDPTDPKVELSYLGYIYYPFQGHYDTIIFGIILSYFLFRKKEWMDSLAWNETRNNFIHATLWIFVILYNSIFSEREYNFFSMVFRFTFNGICFSAIIFFCLHKGFLTRFFSTGLLVPVAKLSYVVYIIHFFLMGFVVAPIARKEHVELFDIFQYWVYSLIVIYFVGYLFHLVAELPFVSLRNKVLEKMSSSQTVVSG